MQLVKERIGIKRETDTEHLFNKLRFLHIYYELISRNTNLKYEQHNELKLRCVQSSGVKSRAYNRCIAIQLKLISFRTHCTAKATNQRKIQHRIAVSVDKDMATT